MDAELVRDLFNYDPETGLLRWRKAVSRHAAGAVAGTVRGDKRYIEVRCAGKYYGAHRLAFLWMTGRWPNPEIDHINQDGTDNRWSNLREATKAQNAANRRVAKTSQTGLKGVIRVTRDGITKFEARIRLNGKQKHLGRYETGQEAHQAYVRAAEQAHGAFARG